MDEHNSSFTALAAQVEELAQVCDRLSQENAELRERVARQSARPALAAGLLTDSPRTFANPLPGGDSHLAGERPPDRTVSRRTIGKALGVAAGVVGAAALVDLGARPAAAVTSRETAIAKEDSKASDNSAGSVVRASLSTTGAVIVADNTGAGAGVQATGKRGRGGCSLAPLLRFSSPREACPRIPRAASGVTCMPTRPAGCGSARRAAATRSGSSSPDAGRW